MRGVGPDRINPSHGLTACEEMPLRYAHSLKGPDTVRHSREGGNPVRSLRRMTYVLDSRLRGNDAIAAFSHTFSVMVASLQKMDAALAHKVYNPMLLG